jgi:SAM-dependent methyltransferase
MESWTDWYAEWFNEDYLATYPHRNEDAAREETSFVCDALGLGQSDLVLDLCCGAGRHMTGLADAGCRVVGVDLSMTLLEQAAERIEGARLVRGDMRRIPFKPGFAAVVSFFTSFGYFEDDEENFVVLDEICRLLRPGGTFMLDLMHASQVRKNLLPVTTRTVGDMAIKEERSLDEDNQRVNKVIKIERAGETKVYRESVRMYSRAEVETAIERKGLAVTEVLGDFLGAPFDEDAARMIVMGRKP